jgi:hypothetical protein
MRRRLDFNGWRTLGRLRTSSAVVFSMQISEPLNGENFIKLSLVSISLPLIFAARASQAPNVAVTVPENLRP